MCADESNLEGLLNDLSLGLVMVDPDDLITLGEILEKVETLAEAFEAYDSAEARVVLFGLRKSIENMILDKAPDKVRVVEILGQGVALLQDIHRSLAAGGAYEGDLNDFRAAVEKDAQVDLSEAPEAAGREAPAAEPRTGPAPPEPGAEMTAEETGPTDEPSADEAAVYDASQDQELFFGFLSESMEHIETIEVNIIALEQDPEDPETINSVFRPFHTIKGVSGFLNLKTIHQLTHNVENVLDDARNQKIPVSGALIDLVLDAVDLLKRMLADVKASLETNEPVTADYGLDDFFQRLQAVQQGDLGRPMESEPPQSVFAGRKLGEILVEQELVSEDELDRILENQENARLRRLGDILVEQGLISQQELEEALALQIQSEGKRLGEILVETGKAEPNQISLAVHQQESLRSQKLGEMLIREKQADAREVSSALREQRKTPDSSGATARTVKVDTKKLDDLVNMVGELVIAQSLVSSNESILGVKDQKLFRDLSHMARITSELQNTAMSMRMVPIRQTFQKMIRLVRDLSRKSGKQIELTMSGEDTEIDRNMVEAIYDPLVHMVRNSVDHGVEKPAARREAGKPDEGWIHLKAFHQGGNVVIQIIDDGQGLNRDRIFGKAVERGLVSPEEHLTDQAVYQLIFQPGFSTADQVTDVSGRGVGMDVVKRAIDKLRGKVEIESEPGRGSTISIRLPLTLAIIDGMIVRVGDNRYILPTMTIRESFRPGRGEYHTVKGQGEMIKVREHLLPLVRLDHVLGVSGGVVDPTQALVIVVEHNGEQRCLLVDEVIGKQEVVIKSLGERLKYVRALAGGSILGDGTVGLILDVTGMFEVSDGMGGGMPPPAAAHQDWEMDDDWGMGPG
jgi:two-component system chemotaxis sensor kinase CheA